MYVNIKGKPVFNLHLAHLDSALEPLQPGRRPTLIEGTGGVLLRPVNNARQIAVWKVDVQGYTLVQRRTITPFVHRATFPHL